MLGAASLIFRWREVNSLRAILLFQGGPHSEPARFALNDWVDQFKNLSVAADDERRHLTTKAMSRQVAGGRVSDDDVSLADVVDFPTGFQAICNRVLNQNDYQPRKVKKLVAHKLSFATLCAPFRLQGRTDSMFASR